MSGESKHNDIEKYICDSGQAVNINFVTNAEDIEAESKFTKPLVTHQIFGQSEQIFGYKNLEVNIHFSHISMNCFVDIKHSGCVESIGNDNIKADNILKLLTPWLPIKFATEKNEFLQTVRNEDGKKFFGQMIDQFQLNKGKEQSKFKITLCNIEEHGFVEFHKRFQCLIIWYIETASFIDMEDVRWMFYYLYYECKTANGDVINYPIGFSTIYKFFAYPDKTRTRISQFFILPTFQRIGLGSKLLHTVYKSISSLPGITDITVEDPNEHFTIMRDYADSMLLMQLPEFSEQQLEKGFSKKMIEAANNHYRINKQQTKKIYEILTQYYSKKMDSAKDISKAVKDFLKEAYF